MSLPATHGQGADRNPNVAAARLDNTGHPLATDQGIPIPDTDNSLLVAGVQPSGDGHGAGLSRCAFSPVGAGRRPDGSGWQERR